MPSNLPQFTLRIPKEQLDKLRYVSEYNARSCNRELELLIRNYIKDFENEHGKITQDDMDKLKSNH